MFFILHPGPSGSSFFLLFPLNSLLTHHYHQPSVVSLQTRKMHISNQYVLATLTLFLRISCVAGNTYSMVDDYLSSPSTLFTEFDFFTGQDPTDGLVKYVDSATAISSALVGVFDGNSSSPFTSGTQAAYIGVDYASVTPAGRPSVRISSAKSYSAGTLIVADIAHVPSGCSVWPAFWLVGKADDWPNSGEIDIFEGVNNSPVNAMTLHTAEGCKVTNLTTAYSGTLETEDCWVNNPNQGNNVGCSIQDTRAVSYGAPFNLNGGGVFITEWLSTGISIWFYPANVQLPASFASSTPSTTDLGLPAAYFSGETCNIDSHFKDLEIVFDTTFCGQWAGEQAVWQGQGCAASTGVSTCNDFVANHPQEFSEAYWTIRALSVYGLVK